MLADLCNFDVTRIKKKHIYSMLFNKEKFWQISFAETLSNFSQLIKQKCHTAGFFHFSDFVLSNKPTTVIC